MPRPNNLWLESPSFTMVQRAREENSIVTTIIPWKLYENDDSFHRILRDQHSTLDGMGKACEPT